jgi:Rrf2 family protein
MTTGQGPMDILRRNTDYALRLAVSLAAHYGDGALSTRALAEQGDVSYQLACKLMQKLHSAGLVESDMGPRGGFQLRREPSEIPIAEVIEAIQGPLRLNRCLLGGEACRNQGQCPVRTKIAELQEQMDTYLGHVMLEDLVQVRQGGRRTKGRRRTE